MSDIDTSGPWGPRDGRAPPPPLPAPAATAPARPTPAAPPLDRGQNPLWALVSTLLLGGFIWWITQSWMIAIAAVFGLFVHEYGHVLAMNRLGMGPARIYIIPFLGGVARSQRLPASEWDGVKVSLAGPAFGLLAAIPFFAGNLITGDPLWLQGVAAIAFLNLVNLAPAPPLDGSKALGPVLARIHPALEMAAMIAVGAAAIWWGFSNGAWIFAAFLALALFSHIRRGAWRPEGRQLTWGEAGKSVALFLLTAAACVGVGALGAWPALVGAAGNGMELI
ncbi:MAG TPA: site-2 protease family protein [Brevundimonas sp.]|jgi:Zn-dependent protease|uniref:metalloprotease n=1 Tax=Brevundimonas sp. TaxID=1871086 RepID=UPI002E0EF1C0|nr:site-2 protease family protein [Brevundimonas sp.]